MKRKLKVIRPSIYKILLTNQIHNNNLMANLKNYLEELIIKLIVLLNQKVLKKHYNLKNNKVYINKHRFIILINIKSLYHYLKRKKKMNNNKKFLILILLMHLMKKLIIYFILVKEIIILILIII